MRIKVTSHLADLQADCAKIATQAPKDMHAKVREGIRAGNTLAKDFAKASSGTHARKYPGTFTASMNKSFYGFGAGIISGEYGPQPRGQGALAPILERGSRNNPAHLNLARSADIIGPSFAQEVRGLPDGWFW